MLECINEIKKSLWITLIELSRISFNGWFISSIIKLSFCLFVVSFVNYVFLLIKCSFAGRNYHVNKQSILDHFVWSIKVAEKYGFRLIFPRTTVSHNFQLLWSAFLFYAFSCQLFCNTPTLTFNYYFFSLLYYF